MKLGAKKRAALLEEARNCVRVSVGDGLPAVVDLLVSRQEEQVAPLLEALRVHAGGLAGLPLCRKCSAALAAYEAAQADEPEPTLAEAVEAMLRPGDGTIPIGGATLVDSCALAAVRAALAREKGGKP